MRTIQLHPVSPETQLEETVQVKEPPHEEIQEKIEFVKKNIQNVVKVNGSSAYNAMIEDDCIFYMLSPKHSRQYYYPIRYAVIEIKTEAKA